MIKTCLIALAGLLLPWAAAAEVVSSASNGFSVRNTGQLAASAEEVWEAVVDVGGYWHPDHTWAGDLGTMTIDPTVGGCFCETIPGGAVEHARVVYVDRSRLLRMEGALGPLQAMGVSGTLTWTITPTEEGSTVELAYSVSGFFPAEGGMVAIAPAVDGVQREVVERLLKFVETGSPD